MATPRRWFQYSLRSFFVLVTAFAVWPGVVVDRARERREAVKAIEAFGRGGYLPPSCREARDGDIGL
jgi:hypothetical protein